MSSSRSHCGKAMVWDGPTWVCLTCGHTPRAEGPEAPAPAPSDPAYWAAEEHRIKAPTPSLGSISKRLCTTCRGTTYFDGAGDWVCMRCDFTPPPSSGANRDR